jgi:hypothetical protein
MAVVLPKETKQTSKTKGKEQAVVAEEEDEEEAEVEAQNNQKDDAEEAEEEEEDDGEEEEDVGEEEEGDDDDDEETDGTAANDAEDSTEAGEAAAADDNDGEDDDDVGSEISEQQPTKNKKKKSKTAKVAVAGHAPNRFVRPQKPRDRDGKRVTQQKQLGRAWKNGPGIDLDHFVYVQEDYRRRQAAVDFIRERMKKKSRPGYELRVQRKWTCQTVMQLILRRHFSWTPCVKATLGDAAWDGDILLMHALLLIRGEVNARDENGQLILNICIQQQHEPITRLLLDRGADVDLQDEKTLMTPLNNSIIMGNKALTRRLFKKGADVNLADAEGMTPLLWASARGYLEVVAQLVEAGAEVNHQDNEGWTPLHVVCFKGYVELVEYFLISGGFFDG